jgi:hypothetical protein
LQAILLLAIPVALLLIASLASLVSRLSDVIGVDERQKVAHQGSERGTPADASGQGTGEII